MTVTIPSIAVGAEEATARTVFTQRFGMAPNAVASAPARANLLGEHTDYNDGYVLPTALACRTAIAIGRHGDPGVVEAYSATLDQTAVARLEAGKQGAWLDYFMGCCQALTDRGEALPGLRVVVAGSVPMGAGISSSAAFEVASLRALAGLLTIDLDPVTLARLGRKAEREFVGMPCGIMDQMISSLGTAGEALLLDTRDLAHRTVPLPTGHRIAVVFGVEHRLVDGGYAQRVAECQAACRALDLPSLRAASQDDLPRFAALDPPLDGRARHVVTENGRVLDGVAALESGDAAAFGRLMLASHASQRDDYAVSTPEIDALVDAAMAAGAIGARLTGGGFGGSIVALVAADRFDPWLAALAQAQPHAQLVATVG